MLSWIILRKICERAVYIRTSTHFMIIMKSAFLFCLPSIANAEILDAWWDCSVTEQWLSLLWLSLLIFFMFLLYVLLVNNRILQYIVPIKTMNTIYSIVFTNTSLCRAIMKGVFKSFSDDRLWRNTANILNPFQMTSPQLGHFSLDFEGKIMRSNFLLPQYSKNKVQT